MNWIEQRVRREQWLEIRTPQVWLELRAALLESAKVFASHFGGHYDIDVKMERDDCVQFFLREMSASKFSQLEVRFDSGKLLVGANGLSDTGISVGVENTRGYLIKEGSEISMDEASRLLLEDFFFAGKPKAKAMVA